MLLQACRLKCEGPPSGDVWAPKVQLAIVVSQMQKRGEHEVDAGITWGSLG